MVARIALACLLAIPLSAVAGRAQEQEQEKPKVPKDSIMVVAVGCIKGRAFRADDVQQTDTTSGYSVRSTTFRLAGKKDVMAIVKEQDGRRAEVTGLIKKSSLIEPGVKFKGGRVIIGGGSTGSPSTSMPSPAENVLVLDAITVVAVGGSCGG